MKWSKLHIPTLREVPADAEVVSHRLLLRAGMVRQLAAGLYSYLPLAQRVTLKIQAILRQEMGRIGGQEFFLPALNPREIWEESGRWSVMGDNMFRLKDRKGADLCLGMTHEEIFTSLARNEIRSYKQLPQIWYQIQTKFRDEARPKSGVLRVRQFIMKDAYSFDLDQAGQDRSFEDQRQAYVRIFSRCGLQFSMVEASSGAMGGSASNEFMVRSDAGEDLIVVCEACGYAANLEKATSRLAELPPDAPSLDAPEKFSTPGVRTIEALTEVPYNAAAVQQIKTLIYVATIEGKEPAMVLALLRGDHQLHETKLADSIGASEVRPAQDDEIVALLGAHPGSLGAHGVDRKRVLTVIADEALRGRENMVTGANEDDHHIRGVSVERHIAPDRWASLRVVNSGEHCLRCDEGLLEVFKAVEIGHIFKLGTKYSLSMGANVLDPNGKAVPIVMGSYGIGVERIMAAAIELHHDDDGIIWPQTIAPFDVVVTITNIKDDEMRIAGERIYAELSSLGLDVLLDDRNERAGVKFKDADLIGIPFRVTLGKRLAEGVIELFAREGKVTEEVAVDDVTVRVAALVTAAKEALTPKE
jgi:prolyl-tRNA synthetase